MMTKTDFVGSTEMVKAAFSPVDSLSSKGSQWWCRSLDASHMMQRGSLSNVAESSLQPIPRRPEKYTGIFVGLDSMNATSPLLRLTKVANGIPDVAKAKSSEAKFKANESSAITSFSRWMVEMKALARALHFNHPTGRPRN